MLAAAVTRASGASARGRTKMPAILLFSLVALVAGVVVALAIVFSEGA
jgi:hypothetical protein